MSIYHPTLKMAQSVFHLKPSLRDFFILCSCLKINQVYAYVDKQNYLILKRMAFNIYAYL